VGRAHHYTGRFEAHFDSVVAEVALVRSVGVWVDVNSVIRARIHAPLASNAIVIVKIDYAVICSE
jgi:hypothetical protein